jgi:hypothetical protein
MRKVSVVCCKSGLLLGVTLCSLLREVQTFRRDRLLPIQGKRVSEAVVSSERMVPIYQTARRHTPQYSTTTTSNATDQDNNKKESNIRTTLRLTLLCCFFSERSSETGGM